MNYALPENRSSDHFAGLALVVALHVVIFYFLATSMIESATKVPPPIDVFTVKDSVVAPLPETTPLPPVQIVNPNVLTLDPPDIRLAPPIVPTSSAPTHVEGAMPTAAVTNDERRDTPVAAVTNVIGVACPNAQSVRQNMRYPAAARRDGIQGDVLVRFVVGAGGEISNVNILSSSNRALNSSAVAAVSQFSCTGQGQAVSVDVPFSFRLMD